MDKISVTLYDLLGYVLPGCVILFTLSVIEATFLGSHHLAISAFAKNFGLSAVACYFLGAVAHSIGSILKDRLPKLFCDKSNRLDTDILNRAREIAKDIYGFSRDDKRELTNLETYLLADSYVVASGRLVEREVLMAREGFYKASMVAMALLSITLLCAAIFGGATVQFGTASSQAFSRIATLSFALCAAALTMVFRRSFRFFNRIKVNNTILLFMAIWSLGITDKQRTQ